MAVPNTPSPIALIMAGGSGTRFWPLSHPAHPKQFIRLFGQESLIQQTASRVVPALVSQDALFLCGLQSHEGLLQEHLPWVSLEHRIFEPIGRNTAPCLALSAARLLELGLSSQTPMVVLPADHHIANPERFHTILRCAFDWAVETKGLITLGICPNSPHTGYGYIESSERVEAATTSNVALYNVARFIEKPNQAKATELIKTKACFWNSGIFVWTLGALVKALEQWYREPFEQIRSALTSPEALASVYASLDPLPVDTALLEKAQNVYTIPADLKWSDIGSWNALYELQAHDASGNHLGQGPRVTLDSSRCLVQAGTQKPVALIGVSDLIVVDTEDGLLITHRDSDQRVKELKPLWEAPSEDGLNQ